MDVEVSDLKVQIEKAKESLKSVDENIKKITGRDPNEPRPGTEGRRLSAGGLRVRDFGIVLGRRNRDVQEHGKDSEPPRKRVAVFSRLGQAAGGRRVVLTGRRRSTQEEVNDDEDDGEEQATKPTIQSSIVSTAKQITKNELISAQNIGEKGKARNRRMFGMLLGTLARFDKDSQGRQSKQAQKQKEVETRLEEETTEERRKLASQRRTLFNERRSQQRRIQLLEQKIALADELIEWEMEWNKKSNFIMTKASPSIFFMPKDFTPRTQRALQDSKGRIKEKIEKHKTSVEETMNGYDDEIVILEGKQNNEDGKGDKKFRGNNLGVRVINSHKRGINEEEAEEEMDLDSMEPQVDIKVEIDENEAEEGGNDGVSNGVLSTEIDSLHPDNQNHDIAVEEEVKAEGKAERTQKSQDHHQQIVPKQEAPSVIADDGTWKGAEDKPNNEPVEMPEVLQVDNEQNAMACGTAEEQQEEQVQNKQEEDLLPDVGDQKQDSCSETEKGGASAKPGAEGCENPEQDSLREKHATEEKMVEIMEHAKSEEFDCEGDTDRSSEKQIDKSKTTTSESLPTAKMEKDASEKTASTQDHSSSSESENDLKLKSSKESTLKKKSNSVSGGEGGRTAHGKKMTEKWSRERSLSGDLRKESKNKEKESRTKKTKPRKLSSEDSSSEEEQVKRKEKEPVTRKGSASERKARIRKRKSETASANESSSDSSSSSENARRKKRSSESRRGGKRRSREKQVSRRYSGSSRRKSRSNSRERQTKRRDRHRR